MTAIWALCAVLSAPGKELPLPVSDPGNSGGWVLNPALSDEFDGSELDPTKWFVQGSDGTYHKWKGRAPSQYAPHNVRIADGNLILTSRWEPGYRFAKEEFDGRSYENITTAGVVSQHSFLYGYMETRSQAADAAMTSSFWTLGYQSELDIFEQMGRPKKTGSPRGKHHNFDRASMFSIHDWRPGMVPGKNRVFNATHQLPFRVADGFHVYGCEWGVDDLKFYIDGKLVHTRTRKELDDAWVLTNPLEIWFDSETFPWLGLPESDDLPVDFKVDYVRVWQKPDPNLLDRAFHGFEGPILLDHVPLPGDRNRQHKFWFIADKARPHFSISGEKYFNGRKSLKFTHRGTLAAPQVSAMAPNGSTRIPAGPHVLEFRLWIDRDSTVTKLHPILDEPWLQIAPVDLTALPRKQWVRVRQEFSREAPSGPKDRLRFTVQATDIAGGISTLFLDDVSIGPVASGQLPE